MQQVDRNAKAFVALSRSIIMQKLLSHKSVVIRSCVRFSRVLLLTCICITVRVSVGLSQYSGCVSRFCNDKRAFPRPDMTSVGGETSDLYLY